MQCWIEKNIGSHAYDILKVQLPGQNEEYKNWEFFCVGVVKTIFYFTSL